MRAAIISDVHGNLPALEAVLADAWKNGVDSYIFAGDYIEYFPWSNEVLARLKSLNRVYAVAGNGEERVKYFLDKAGSIREVEQMYPCYYTCSHLTADNIEYLSGLEKSASVRLPHHGKAYVTHWTEDIFCDKSAPWRGSSIFKKAMEAKPFSHEEFLELIALAFRDKRACAALRQALPGNDASVIIFGHNHLQWHGWCGGRLIIDPGSCGFPLDGDSRAPYTILTDTEKGLDVEEKRVRYDVEGTIDRVYASDFYQRGKVWCEMMFRGLRTSLEVWKSFYDTAGEIAREKGEKGDFFTNETWCEAGERFFGEKDLI